MVRECNIYSQLPALPQRFASLQFRMKKNIDSPKGLEFLASSSCEHTVESPVLQKALSCRRRN